MDRPHSKIEKGLVRVSESQSCDARHFHFILSYLNTKPYQLKKKRETIQMSIYIYIKSYNFAGLPRDRASGRMLIL